jgi:hypothetical protein
LPEDVTSWYAPSAIMPHVTRWTRCQLGISTGAPAPQQPCRDAWPTEIIVAGERRRSPRTNHHTRDSVGWGTCTSATVFPGQTPRGLCLQRGLSQWRRQQSSRGGEGTGGNPVPSSSGTTRSDLNKPARLGTSGPGVPRGRSRGRDQNHSTVVSADSQWHLGEG